MKNLNFYKKMFLSFFFCFWAFLLCLSGPEKSIARETAANKQQELQDLAVQGELTVRAMRAWGMLPERFMHLALELRSQGINLLDADMQTLSELLDRAVEDELLNAFAHPLEELAEYMHEFVLAAQSFETKAGINDVQKTAKKESLSVSQQQNMARTLFARIDALDDDELDEMEKLYHQVMQKAPDTGYAQESYWRLSNMYMRAYSPSRNLDAIDILETYVQRYPGSTFLDDQFAMFATPGMPTAKKRLLYLYETEELWSEAADLYGQLIVDLDASGQDLLEHYISYGRVLENLDRNEEAVAVYKAYLQNTEKDSRTLQNAARTRLSALGAEVPETRVRVSFDNLFDAAQAGSLAEVKRLVQEGADVTSRRIVGAPRYGRASEENPIGPGDMGTESIDPLHFAVAKGHIEVVKYLLEQGADPGSAGEQNWRLPLMLAAENSDLEVAMVLLDAGADVDATGRGGAAALHFAALMADSDFVQVLIDAGASIDKKCRRGQLPLHYAAGNPAKNVAEMLIQAGSELEARDNAQRTALHLAVVSDNLAVGELLISSGADTGTAMSSGDTALHMAATLEDNARPWVEMLLEEGADVLATNNDGAYPFDYAVRYSQPFVMESLFVEGIDLDQEFVQQMTYLHSAVLQNRYAVAEKLLQLGANADAVNYLQMTPLMLAAQHGSKESAAVLLKYDADISLVDGQHRTALQLAIGYREAPVVSLLLENGADPEYSHHENLTALLQILNHYYAEADEVKTITEVLLAAGADTNVKDGRGNTPLHLAAGKGNTQMVKQLLEKGLKVDEPGPGELTPLHLAAQGGHLDIVELLVQSGADIQVQNRRGNTAMELAHSNGHSEVVLMLEKSGASLHGDLFQAAAQGDAQDIKRHIDSGANVNAVDDDQNTALHLALAAGHKDAAETLLKAGANVNALNKRHETPLHKAVMTGEEDLLEILLQNGAEIEVPDRHGFTALHVAVVFGNTGIADKLLELGAELQAQQIGLELMFEAVYQGQIPGLEYLLEHGVSINAQDEDGWSVLHVAAYEVGNPEIVDYLISRGADIDLEDAQGHTPLDLVGEIISHEIYLNIAEMLIAHGAKADPRVMGWSELRIAAVRGEVDQVRQVLADSPEQLTEDEDWAWPILHSAARAGHADVLEILIESGADLEYSIGWGAHYTPLVSAAMEGKRDAVQVLLQKGADPDPLQRILLSAIGHNRDMEILTKFAEAGVDLDAGSDSWDPPLFQARDQEMLQHLLDLGADVNVRNLHGETRLNVAVADKKSELTGLLLQYGADPDLQDHDGNTPLHSAVDEGNVAMAALLLENGASADVTNDEGLTPLQVVEENTWISNRSELLDLLAALLPTADLVWKFGTGGPVDSSARYSNGHIFIAGQDNYLYSLDQATGSKIWSFKTADTIFSSPAVVEGVVYTGSLDGFLYAVHQETGEEKWRFNADKDIVSSPYHWEGSAFISNLQGDVFAVDAETGDKIWKFESGSRSISSAVILDGVVYFGSGDGELIALDGKNGEKLWSFETEAEILSSPALTEDMVVVGDWQGNVYALDAESGQELWSTQAGRDLLTVPVIARDRIYVGSLEGYMYALDLHTGKEIWKFDSGGGIQSSPAMAGNTLYFGDSKGILYALDSESGREKWRFSALATIISSPLILNDIVYFGSYDGHVYAVSYQE